MRSADGTTQIETFSSLEELPDDAAALFEAARSFFATRAWWEIVLRHGLPAGALPRLVVIRQNGAAGALFPMVMDPASGGLRALTTPYSCLYEPLIGPNCTGVFTAFRRSCQAFATTRLDALDQATAAYFASGAEQDCLTVARFDHFGNWYQDVSGLDWTAWLAHRPGALRETIRRRTRRAAQMPGGRFTLFHQANDMTIGIAAFETVYANSWKQPEPYPAFNPAQIRAALSLGLARLAVWWVGDTPAAAQFWIVEHGRASMLKLAHDEAFKSYSPGTVLTAWMIRNLLELDHISELDFGRGDDPYKRDWVADRRQRMGLLLINRRHPRGMAALAWHRIGRIGRIAARMRQE